MRQLSLQIVRVLNRAAIKALPWSALKQWQKRLSCGKQFVLILKYHRRRSAFRRNFNRCTSWNALMRLLGYSGSIFAIRTISPQRLMSAITFF